MVLEGENILLERLMTYPKSVEPKGRTNRQKLFGGGCMNISLISIRKFTIFIMCLRTSFLLCILFKHKKSFYE